MTLGQRIQAHRTRLGLSQEGLGEKLGVSRQAVSRWEADGAVPDTDKLIALSKLFGITLNELLQVEDPPEQGAKRPRGRWKLLLLAAVCFLAGGRYWATLTAPNTGGEVSIVLVKNGREQTAAVGEYGHFS